MSRQRSIFALTVRRRRICFATCLVLAVGLLLVWPVEDFAPQQVVEVAQTPQAEAEHLEGHAAAEKIVQLMQRGKQLLESTRDFCAILHKQERLGDTLTEPNQIELKMRREPMSVHMKWITAMPGQEVLWQQDAYDGKLLYHDCGWKGRLVPMIKLAPDNRLVTAMSRRSIDQIGVWKLAEELAARRGDLDRPNAQVSMEFGTCPDGRPCYVFRIVHPQRHADLENYLTVIYIDREWDIPVGCELYDWPPQPEADPPLLESYFYEAVKFDVGLADVDFDPSNPQYAFTRERMTSAAE